MNMVELFYAEDDADIAGAVKEYLEQKNFKVMIYNTIAEVRQALKSHVPAVILLDWNMPDGRGDSLCRWIRSRWTELPIIFLTVRDDSENQKQYHGNHPVILFLVFRMVRMIMLLSLLS